MVSNLLLYYISFLVKSQVVYIHDKKEEIFIIGGAEIYRQAIDIADKLYITHIDAEDKSANSFFPEIIPIVFLETKREEHKKDEKNAYNYAFVTYKRF